MDQEADAVTKLFQQACQAPRYIRAFYTYKHRISFLWPRKWTMRSQPWKAVAHAGDGDMPV